ncbi:hypothetical protein SAMN04487844_14738 [Methylobacterium sp. yr596]|nr:hypothetical protein SAMN04487844_14738 [Methylobacterium sp. yr596]
MGYRLSFAQIRADFEVLGSRYAVARKHGVSEGVIALRAPGLKGPHSVGFMCDPLRRAAFLHYAGMTLDEAASETGVGVKALVLAIRSHHARQQQRAAARASRARHASSEA